MMDTLSLEHFWVPFFFGYMMAEFVRNLLRTARKGLNPPDNAKNLEPEVKLKEYPQPEARFKFID